MLAGRGAMIGALLLLTVSAPSGSSGGDGRAADESAPSDGLDDEIRLLERTMLDAKRALLEKRAERAATHAALAATDRTQRSRRLQASSCTAASGSHWVGSRGEQCVNFDASSDCDSPHSPDGVYAVDACPQCGVCHDAPGTHAGGHTTDLWKTAQCVPVPCGEEAPGHALHHADMDVGADMADGCTAYDIFNFMKNESDTVHLTCEGCVPNTCAYGEHDCVPVFCEDQHGEKHGGHSTDPCEGGHHAEDGLAWWPFLLVCLFVTVVVTVGLEKLATLGFSPPFTVVMFFFGYAVSALCSEDPTLAAEAQPHEGVSGLLFNSVQSWKGTHPHVILFVLLPPLLFEDASGMDYYVFRKVLLSSIILAGPGVGISMALTACTTMLMFGFAEECVVEVDEFAGTGQLEVAGAREFTGGVEDGEGGWVRLGCFPGSYKEDGTEIMPPTSKDGLIPMPECKPVCDPGWNADWEAVQGPDGGFICLECVEDSYQTELLPVSVHLLLGGMLAATDPVAVCAVLNDLGCPDKLNYMIAGESLLNDGTAVVAFMVMQSVAGGCDTDAVTVLMTLVKLAGGGVVWGLFVSALCYNSMKYIQNPNVEITTLVFACLSTFWIAENVIHVSGVLGTVVFGVQTARTSFLAMDEHTHHANHAFWGEVGFVATSIIFIVAGVRSRDKIDSFIDNFAEDFAETDTERDEICNPISDEVVCLTHHICRWDIAGTDADGLAILEGCRVNPLAADESEFHVGNQLFLNLALWVVLGFIRAFVVGLFSPLLKKIGYGLTLKEAVVMVWGGLRGAVSLSLALLIDGNHLIGGRARELIFLQTTGIVTLTLIINGTSSGMVYKWLQVYPPNPFRPVLATQGLRNINIEIESVMHKLGKHWFHCNADFNALLKLLPDFQAAYMEDGDLTGVEMCTMEEAWVRNKETMLIPAPATTPQMLADAASTGVKIYENCPPVNFEQSPTANARPQTPDGHDNHGHGHDHDDHGGHGGHGPNHVDKLKNIKAWLDEVRLGVCVFVTLCSPGVLCLICSPHVCCG